MFETIREFGIKHVDPILIGQGIGPWFSRTRFGDYAKEIDKAEQLEAETRRQKRDGRLRNPVDQQASDVYEAGLRHKQSTATNGNLVASQPYELIDSEVEKDLNGAESYSEKILSRPR